MDGTQILSGIYSVKTKKEKEDMAIDTIKQQRCETSQKS